VQKILLWNNSCIRKNYDISKSYVLQASLPETTYFCIENKLAERPQTGGSQNKDYNQSKLTISQLTGLKTAILGH